MWNTNLEIARGIYVRIASTQGKRCLAKTIVCVSPSSITTCVHAHASSDTLSGHQTVLYVLSRYAYRIMILDGVDSRPEPTTRFYLNLDPTTEKWRHWLFSLRPESDHDLAPMPRLLHYLIS